MTSGITNRVGLLGPLAGSDDAAVDIVMVHGLTGNREGTWTGRFDTFWPKTLLPKDIPSARIWTWGYDANILHFFDKKSENALDDYSKQLCADLAGVRTQKPDRPIIFLVHSLGGLVCENALCLATINAEKHIKDIATCTRGIIFLGTPLKGSAKIKWVDIAHKFAKLLGQDKNKDVVSALAQQSPRLQKMADSFVNILRDRSKTEQNIEVVFFYEEFGTGQLGPIVTKESATVDGYEAQGIPADHSTMTKFDSDAEPGYIRIKVVLQRWVEALQKTGKPNPVSGVNVHQEIGKVLGGLAVGYLQGDPTITSNIYDSERSNNPNSG